MEISTDARAKVLKAAADGCPAEASNGRDAHDSAVTPPLGQESGEQPPPPFVERGHDAIDRSVIESGPAARLVPTHLTRTSINRPPVLLVRHDQGSHP